MGFAVLAFFLLILGIGGLSSFLAWSILSIAQEIPAQSHDIEMTDGIQATLHHMIREVDRAVIQGSLDRQSHLEALSARAATAIKAYLETLITEEEPFPEKEKEIALIQTLEKLHTDLDRAAVRIVTRVAAKTRAAPEDLIVLDAVADQLPELAHQLNEIHHVKIRRLVAGGISRMRVILGAYLVFLVGGGGCVIAGVLLFSRTVALPLRRLASATLDFAAGDFGKRVPIGSRDEIGQLSQSFNTMAETLERREAELRGAQADLSRRVMETQALHRIGVEISSMLEIDKVLHSVVEKAQALLQSQGAVLCLFPSGDEGPRMRVVSGAVETIGPNFKAGCLTCLPGAGERLCLGSAPHPICLLLDGTQPGASLGVPLTRGTEVLGVLCVGWKEPRAFQLEERQLLEGLAAQAAIAIENARLYKEVGSLATVRERERIARELHDGLAQAVGYLRFRLETLEDRLERAGQPPRASELAEMRITAGKAYEDIRQSIFGLRIAVSKGLGLIPILTEYLHEFSQQSGVSVELQNGDPRATRFSPEAEIQLIRVIQEALANIRKHAGARHASVQFIRDGEMGCVTIADDGAGFSVEALPGDDRRRFGLRTMRERAEGLGGTLEIRSRPGRGTQVVIRIPLAREGVAP